LEAKGEQSSPEDEGTEAVFSVVWLPDAPKHSGHRIKMASVRKGRWKLISNISSGRDFLYDLAEDPLELQDLASRETERVVSLKSVLEDWLESTSKRAGTPTIRPLSREEEKRLKALGYL
jgi:hypothetical protein